MVTPAGMLTATGTERRVIVPSPSSPRPFCPQHHAAPALVIAHVWLGPASMLANFTEVATATGAFLAVFELSPSWP